MKPGDTNTGWSKLVMLISAGCCSLLGPIALLGWYSSSAILTQMIPSLSPMQPNTALSFWLCGAGLLALVFGRRRLAAVSGAVVTALGLLTVLQHTLTVDLGIDQFWTASEITRPPGHPGRVAPAAALCFTISGPALVAMSRPASHRYRPLLLGACASLVTAPALAVLVGYATGMVDGHRGGAYIQVAVHSAIGFISMGAGILSFAWRADRADTRGTPTWLPVLIGIGVLTATLYVWEVLAVQERAYIKRMIKSETASARSVRSELAAGLDAQIHVLQRMARRWENTGKPVKEDWAALNIPEQTLVRSDGEAHPFHTVQAPIFNAEGEVATLVGVSRDITERKREERALAQARDAALESARLKSAFLPI